MVRERTARRHGRPRRQNRKKVAEVLELPPFPPLMWDGLYWRADFTLPWCRVAPPRNLKEERPQLVVRPDYSRSIQEVNFAAAPRPTDAQAAAVRYLLDSEKILKPLLLAEFQRWVPELAEADWSGLEGFFEAATVLIFQSSLDGVSYVGLVFRCLRYEYGYEHGAGIVLHRDRVVHFGIAEEAKDEAQALKDLRRIARTGKRP